MNYPEWVTPANLGTFSQDYGFEINPVIIEYSAGLNSVVSQINGSLPVGLRLEKSANIIRILGACEQVENNINVQFTLRITQTNGSIADRTYYMLLTAVADAPSWSSQLEFLGYQNTTLPQNYQLVATAPAGQYVTYSIQSVSVTPPILVSTSINPITGVLTCDASNVIVNNTIIDITIRASTTAFSDITCSIEVITVPGAPEWVTPAGSLGTYSGDDFIEINLLAKDLNNNPVTYELISDPNTVPVSVAQDGLLYGRLPNVIVETYYTIVVMATSTGTSTRTFTLVVMPSASTSLLQWVSNADLGYINDGSYASIPMNAVTKRNRLIIYNLSGGSIPPNMIINKTTGALEGFCEYHAISKNYTFDISATDGYQTITKQFTLRVEKLYNDIFFGVSVPLMGQERTKWILDAANVRIREPGTKIFDSFYNIENPPALNVIRGVLTNYDNLNWSTGSISSVSVINPGENYTSPPKIKITGSGDGATLRAMLGLVNLNILNAGENWIVGDVVEIKTGIANSYARITITNVNNIGGIVSFVIDYPGDYIQVPSVDTTTLEKDSETFFSAKFIWGITSVDVISCGSNYQNLISFDTSGSEILPWWQKIYAADVSVGNINGISGSTASNLLNSSVDIVYGNRWRPNYVVFYWEGIRWTGSSTFDVEQTTFDGNTTGFEETESAYQTIFDDQLTYFEQNYTTFDYIDPLEYDQASIWGRTIFDDLLTIFDYYSTVFDRAMPRKTSKTVYRKLVRVNNKVYSGNNAVW